MSQAACEKIPITLPPVPPKSFAATRLRDARCTLVNDSGERGLGYSLYSINAIVKCPGALSRLEIGVQAHQPLGYRPRFKPDAIAFRLIV